MERWTILRKGADFERIGKKFRISPRLACLIRNRDIVGDEEVRQYRIHHRVRRRQDKAFPFISLLKRHFMVVRNDNRHAKAFPVSGVGDPEHFAPPKKIAW